MSASWEWLPLDAQIAIVWHIIARLAQQQGTAAAPGAWRDAEVIELINRFFHSRTRHVVLLLGSIAHAHKEQAIADRFCVSCLSLVRCLLDDLPIGAADPHLLNLLGYIRTMVWARAWGTAPHARADPGRDKGVYLAQLEAFKKHIEASVVGVLADALLREARRARARPWAGPARTKMVRPKTLRWFVKTAFGHVNRNFRWGHRDGVAERLEERLALNGFEALLLLQ